jgi:DNA-binding transcriptional LysR family regulator
MGGAQTVPLLRVGILRSVPSRALADAVAALPPEDRGPGLELVEGSERELVGHVARGRLDIALTLVDRGGDRFLEEPLLEEGYALAMPAGHPLADRETIAGEALANNVMIVRRHCEALSETSRHFTERGVRPYFALRSTDDDRVLHMVAAGLGVTVMPDSFRHSGVARPRLTGFGARRTIGLIYGAQAEALRDGPSPFIMALRTAFRSQETTLRTHNS